MTYLMQHPSAIGEVVARSMLNPHDWKLPTKSRLFSPSENSLALEVATALNDLLGGHEEIRENGYITLSSRGYYFYIGS